MGRLLKLVRKIAGLSFFLILLITASRQIGCRNPHDFEPPEDSLITHPDPPTLLEPEHQFVFMPGSYPYIIRLSWTTVEGAEIYERELIQDTFPPTYVNTQQSWYDLAVFDIDAFSWRIRASSSDWQGGYTEWSEQKSFEVRFRPSPPQLLYPLDGAVFNFDSLPQTIEFTWRPTSDEQFYEFQLYYDSLLIEQTPINDTVYPFEVYDPGEYYWCIRAGSNHWQYYTDWSNPWDFTVIVDSTNH